MSATLGSDAGDPHSPGLRSQAQRAALTTSAGQVLTQLGSVAATVILARLLSPAEFGVIAMAQSVVAAGMLLSLTGLNASLVTRRGDVSRAASTYFWVSTVGGTLVAAILAFAAPLLARASGLAETEPFIAVLAIGFPLSVMTLVPQALLQRRLQFTAWNVSVVAPAAVYFVGEVILVALGFGAWGVIIAQVVSSAVGLVLALVLARWLPRRHPALAELKTDLNMLSGLTLSQILAYLYKNLDYWVVGRLLGAGALGGYYLAYVLPTVLRQRLTSVYRTVLLPILSGSDTSAQAIARWRDATTMTMFLSLPALTGLAALAGPTVDVFFGEQWTTIVNPLRILAVGSVVDLLVVAVGTMAMAQRRVGGHTSVLGFRLLSTAAALALAFSMNAGTIEGAAWAVTGAGMATLAYQEIAVSRHIGIGIDVIAQPLLRTIGCSLVMAAVVTLVVSGLGGSPSLLKLVVGISAGAIAYFACSFVVARELTRAAMALVLHATRPRRSM